MIHIDEKYNQGNLWNSDDIQRRDEWKEWVDTRLSKPPFQSSMARF